MEREQVFETTALEYEKITFDWRDLFWLSLNHRIMVDWSRLFWSIVTAIDCIVIGCIIFAFLGWFAPQNWLITLVMLGTQ
jgi:hypothetical protein